MVTRSRQPALNRATQVRAAQVVVETVLQMAAEQKPLMQRILPATDVHWWAHYPDNDARDVLTSARWYYHAHEPGDRDPREHGHFHLFLPQSRFRNSQSLLARPPEDGSQRANVVHIAALSVDHFGVPLCWFTTNRWVTDEWLYAADTVSKKLPLFNVDHTEEDGVVNRFLTAMVQLYSAELSQLLDVRDTRLNALGASSSNPEVFESGNDVLSSASIDLDAKVDAVTGA